MALPHGAEPRSHTALVFTHKFPLKLTSGSSEGSGALVGTCNTPLPNASSQLQWFPWNPDRKTCIDTKPIKTWLSQQGPGWGLPTKPPLFLWRRPASQNIWFVRKFGFRVNESPNKINVLLSTQKAPQLLAELCSGVTDCISAPRPQ